MDPGEALKAAGVDLETLRALTAAAEAAEEREAIARKARRVGKPADAFEDGKVLTADVLAGKGPFKPTDPVVIAYAFATDQAKGYGGVVPFRFYRGRWYLYADGRYRPEADGEMETTIRKAADAWLLRVATRRGGDKAAVKKDTVTNTLEALRTLPAVCIPSDTRIPCRITADGPKPAGDVIVFRNGTLDVAAHTAGEKGAFRKTSPELFNLQSLDFDFDPAAKCPTWERVVREILGGSDALVDFMQEWYGYSLVPDTTYEKALLLFGPGGNGKSTLVAPLQSIMGPTNRSSLGLDQFGDRFSLPLTEGKLVNICADQGGVTIDGKAEGNLKRLISGEPIATERKGLDVFDLIPTARLIVCANNWPKFKDKSKAFPARFVTIELTGDFRDAVGSDGKVKDDKGMKTPAFWMAERAGIVNWALIGLKSLRDRGHFEVPPEAEAAARKCWASKSASYFLKRFVRLAEGHRQGIDDLYRKYETQTRDAGYAACDKATFGAAVHALFPEIKGGRKLAADGRDTACIGIEYVKDGV